MKIMKKSVKSLMIYLKHVFKNSNIILAQKQPEIYSVCYLKLDLIPTPTILYKQRGYLNVHINAAKFVRCM